MEQNTLLQAARMMYDQVRKKRWHKVVSCLAAVVVFCTTYALILPAITMTEEYICGYAEEHTHDESCFEMQVPLPTLKCSFDGSEADIVLHTHDEQCEAAGCILAENVAHAHSPECYVTHEEVVCGFEEAHLHSDACYVSTRTDELICTLVEGEGHTHADGCYDENGVLVCAEAEQEAHVHSDECYVWEKSLTCTLEEDPSGHFHVDGCFEYREELVCDAAEVVPHEHDDSCYAEGALVCEKPVVVRHQHGNECYIEPENTEPVKVLTCQLEEHVHDENCYPAEDIYYCGYAEHEHGDACRSADGSLICEEEAHTHDESCMTEPELSAVERVRAIIEALPDIEDVEARMLELEEAEDMEGLEAYWYEVGMQGRVAYEAYMELSEEDQAVLDEDTELMNRLDNLKPYWSRVTLELVSSFDVYQTNWYNDSNGGSSAVLFYGKSADDYGIANMGFGYWSAITVEKDSSGRFYVTDVNITMGEDKSSIAPSNTGFVVLVYSGVVDKNLLDVKIGDRVIVPFDCTLTQAYTGTSYGKISFVEGDNNHKLNIVEAADTDEFIELNLYDYGTNINDPYNSNNKYPGFQQDNGTTTNYSTATSNFGNNITSDLAAGISELTNKGGDINKTASEYNGTNYGTANIPISGAMSPVLQNGYPALLDGTSLKYLFHENSGYAAKQNAESINGLFKHNAVTGEYSFNSRENHAQFDPNTDTFTLYEEIISSNFTMYPFGNFLPLNDITKQSAQFSEIDRDYLKSIAASAKVKANSGAGNEYSTLSTTLERWIELMDAKYPNGWDADEAVEEYFNKNNPVTGSKIDFDQIDAGYKENTGHSLYSNLYTIDYDEATNFFFGMEMKMNFMQPKGGMTGNDTNNDGESDYPMEFYFTGDDDVWVYIDDVMFLDLSGIHRHVGGEIDFVNGVVNYYVLDPGTGDVAGEPYKSVTFAEILGSTDGLNEKGTFKDYSTHSFNFYYMERGAGSGVCRINFNFPLLKQNSINVSKAVSADTDIKGDPDYKFQVFKANADGTKTNQLFIAPETEYTIYDENFNAIGTGITDANGVFNLKAGQRAEFAGIKESAGKYYVRELLEGTVLEQYGNVTVSGEATTTVEGITIGSDTFNGMDSPVKDMSDGTTAFRFINDVEETKLGSLSVSKKLTEYSNAREIRYYDIEVMLDGEKLPVGTKYTVGGAEREVVTEGIISIAADETAVISNILAGTAFSVQETSGSAEGYTVTYTENGGHTITVNDGKAEGVIKTQATVELIVTNSEKGTDVTIPGTKKLINPQLKDDGTYTEYDFTFRLTEVVSSTDMAVKEGGIADYTTTVKVSGDQTAGFAFNISYVQVDIGALPQTFYYKITEDQHEAALDNATTYVVEVTVSESDGLPAAAITKMWRNGTEITETEYSADFENTLYTFILPETGADGTLIYELGGPIMSFASMASLLYIQIRRKNRAGGSDDPC